MESSKCVSVVSCHLCWHILYLPVLPHQLYCHFIPPHRMPFCWGSSSCPVRHRPYSDQGRCHISSIVGFQKYYVWYLPRWWRLLFPSWTKIHEDHCGTKLKLWGVCWWWFTPASRVLLLGLRPICYWPPWARELPPKRKVMSVDLPYKIPYAPGW